MCAPDIEYTPHAGSGSNDSVCAPLGKQHARRSGSSIGYCSVSLIESPCRRYVSLIFSASFSPFRIHSRTIRSIPMTRMVLSSEATIRQSARLFSKFYYLSILIQIALLIGINVYSRNNHPNGFSTEVLCIVVLSILLITCVSAFKIQVKRYQNFLLFVKDVDPSQMAWCCCDSNPDYPDCCSCCNSCCLYLPINLSRRRFNNSICCDGCCNCCIDCCLECAGEQIKLLPPGLSQDDIVYMANHRVIYYPRVREEREMQQNKEIRVDSPMVVGLGQCTLEELSAQPVMSIDMKSMPSMEPIEPIEPISSIPSIPSIPPTLPVHPLTLPQQLQPVQPNFLPTSFPETHESPSLPPSAPLDRPPRDSYP